MGGGRLSSGLYFCQHSLRANAVAPKQFEKC